MDKKSFQEFRHDIYKYNLSAIDELNDHNLRIDYTFSNGCGVECTCIDLIPDTNWGIDISSAYFIKDILYTRSKGLADLFKANKIFKQDLDKIINYESSWFLRCPRLIRNKIYFLDKIDLGVCNYARERGFIND